MNVSWIARGDMDENYGALTMIIQPSISTGSVPEELRIVNIIFFKEGCKK